MVKSLYIPAELSDEIRKSSFSKPSSAIGLFIKEILKRYGSAVQAILFYGSCLGSRDGPEGLMDLYVIVDTYRSAFKNTVLAALNWILPPNVFYIELCLNERKVRAKYAVLSIKDIEKGTSMHCFHSYFWGRFCQPIAMVYIGSEQADTQVNRALANAVITFFTRTIPCIRQEFTVRELWTTGLGLSYAAELRPERPASDGMMEKHHALAGRQQLVEAGFEVCRGRDQARRLCAEIDARHVIEDQDIPGLSGFGI
jgi:hypothetical protein